MASDLFPQYSQIIDIGGDRYFLGYDTPVELGFKSRGDFQKAFDNTQTTERLLRKYFPFGRDYQKIDYTSPKERADVISILEQRLKTLKASRKYNSITLANAPTRKYYENTEVILRFIRDKSAIKELVSEKEMNNVLELSEAEQFQLILEMAWYLLHPDKIDDSIQKQWIHVIRELKDMRIGSLVEQIRAAENDDGDGISVDGLPAAPLNYFKRINIGTVAREKGSVLNALKSAREQVLEARQERLIQRLEQRLRSILTILQAHRYIDDSRADDIVRSMNDNTFLKETAELDRVLVSKIDASLDPIFDYYRIVYDPIYQFIEDGVKGILSRKLANGRLQTPIPMEAILRIVHLGNNWDKKAKGIVRIRGAGQMVPFLKVLGQNIVQRQEELRKVSGQAPKDFLTQLRALPTVRLRSQQGIPMYENPDTIADCEVYVGDQIQIPFDEFALGDVSNGLLAKVRQSHSIDTDLVPEFLKHINLGLAHKSIADFFKPDDIYMVCSDRTAPEKTPYRLMDIELSRIPMISDVIRGDNVDGDYFMMIQNKPERKRDGFTFYLTDIITKLGTSVTPPFLALNTLIAFKEQITVNSTSK